MTVSISGHIFLFVHVLWYVVLLFSLLWTVLWVISHLKEKETYHPLLTVSLTCRFFRSSVLRRWRFVMSLKIISKSFLRSPLRIWYYLPCLDWPLVIMCPDPLAPTNGGRTGDDFSYAMTVRFHCNEGYRLDGVPAAVCLANGSWSDPTPRCVSKCMSTCFANPQGQAPTVSHIEAIANKNTITIQHRTSWGKREARKKKQAVSGTESALDTTASPLDACFIPHASGKCFSES